MCLITTLHHWRTLREINYSLTLKTIAYINEIYKLELHFSMSSSAS